MNSTALSKLEKGYIQLDWKEYINRVELTKSHMETIIDNNKMGKKYFKMYVRDIDKNIIGYGIGSSKQKGEKIAAKFALQYLKVIPHDFEDEILPSNSNLINFRNILK